MNPVGPRAIQNFDFPLSSFLACGNEQTSPYCAVCFTSKLGVDKLWRQAVGQLAFQPMFQNVSLFVSSKQQKVNAVCIKPRLCQ